MGGDGIVDSGHAEAAGRLIEDLNRLRREVGNPSLGRLAQLSGGQFRKTTLDDHLAHRRVRLPQWDLVAAFITACHRAATAESADGRFDREDSGRADRAKEHRCAKPRECRSVPLAHRARADHDHRDAAWE